MACGTYLASGRWARNRGGDFLLVLRHGSSSPVELLVVDGPLTEKLDRLGTETVARVLVTDEVGGQRTALVHLKEFVKTPLNENEILRLEQAAPCEGK